GLAANGLRCVIGRARPDSGVEAGFYGFHHDSQWLVTQHSFHSLPSAHTSVAMGFFAPIVLCAFNRRRPNSKWCWAALAPVGLIAASRLYLRAHYLSDVVAAALLGWLLASLVARWLPPRLRFRTGQNPALEWRVAGRARQRLVVEPAAA